MKPVAIVPARLRSTRLPRKLLLDLDGVPVLAHVVRRVASAACLEATYVATGDEEILASMKSLGIDVLRTASDLPTGTDRVAEASRMLGAEMVVNVQGDEPLVAPEHVETMVEALLRAPEVAVSTLRHPLPSRAAADANRVKLIVDHRRRALYFSRYPLAQEPGRYYKHLGMYAFRAEALRRFSDLGPSPQERAERLEQLRFLHAGLPIVVADAPRDTLGINTAEDYERIRRLFASSRSQGSLKAGSPRGSG